MKMSKMIPEDSWMHPGSTNKKFKRENMFETFGILSEVTFP